MSLITRCPACGTMFKVVADQLKVSQGWVRCGQCSDVFDASLHLQSMPLPDILISNEPEAKAPAPPSATSSASSTSPPSIAAASASQVRPVALSPEPVRSQHEDVWSPGVSFADSSPSPLPAWHRSLKHADAFDDDFDPSGWKERQRFQPFDASGAMQLKTQGEAVGGTSLDQAVAGVPVPVPNAALADRFEPLSSGATDDLSFVRDAKRKAFWRQPAVRLALFVSGLLLALLLIGQVLIQQRNNFAVMEPRLTPVLQKLCQYLQCEIGPLRRIDAVVIESSSFNKIGKDAFRLSFSLKNLATASVAMPSLEVTLTDTQDQALLRRVFTPAQFGATSAILTAGGDFAGVVAMQVSEPGVPGNAGPAAPAAPSGATGAPRVAGYRLLAFYP